MSSVPTVEPYQQVAEKFRRLQQERDKSTARKVKIGFIIFWVVDSALLTIGTAGYLVYTSITIDPSQAFKALVVVSGALLVLSSILWAAYCDLMKPRPFDNY